MSELKTLEFKSNSRLGFGSWTPSCYQGDEAKACMEEHEADIEKGYISNLEYRWKPEGDAVD